MNFIIEERKKVVEFYNSNLNFNLTKTIKIRENTNWNYSYYPLIFNSEETLLRVQKALNKENIFPRRYFYPSLNTIKYINAKKMPIAEATASSIMCLPLYVGLTTKELNQIFTIINNEL